MHSFRLRDTAARCRKEAENGGNGRLPSAVSFETAQPAQTVKIVRHIQLYKPIPICV